MLSLVLRSFGIALFAWCSSSLVAAADDGEKVQSSIAKSTPPGAPASRGSPSECDRLAGSPYHPETIGVGVGVLKIVPERAIAACEAEVQAAPQVARLRYQIARALLAGRHHTRARAELDKAVELGDGQAMLLLATLFQQGVVVPHDHARAVNLARRAAEVGHPAAFSRLSYYYRNGIGVPYDSERAFDYAKRAAEAGWIGGMRQVANALADGIGAPIDKEEANRWGRLFAATARSIADNGDGNAMREFAYALQKGWVGPIDHGAALAWYQKAVEAGDPFALHSLGWIHEHGLGVAKNQTVACDFYERAAATGEPASVNNLALCYERGEGRDLDISKALSLFEAANLSGDSHAPRNIARIYRDGRGVAKDLAKAAAYFRQSALRGLPLGMLDYGIALTNGDGVPVDHSAGCDWFAKAADLHHARSINNLGICYLSGEGRTKDAMKGLALLERAVAMNDDLAIRNLAKYLLLGVGVPRDADRAIALMRRSAEAGSQAGMVEYGVALLAGKGGSKDSKAGCEMLKKAADADAAGGNFGYGFCLEAGLAGRKQPKQALTYYERAGARNHPLAIQAAARMLDEGIAGKRDGAKAAFWLRKGLATGDSRLASGLITAPQNWSLATRRALQRILRDEGHYTGPVDGQFTANLDEVLWSSALIASPAGGRERLVQEIVRVPAKGAEHGLLVRLCRSPSIKSKALVVINHGMTNDVKRRRETRATACGDLARFFTERGYTVAFPVRRGYGETAGALTEVNLAGCQNSGNLVRGGGEIAKDIRTVITHLSERIDIGGDNTLVVGHSGGGWGVLALAGSAPKGVAGFVNVSGAYGSRKGLPNTYCGDKHVAAAASFGKAAVAPSIWVYVENDSYIGSRVARQMHAAFARGGSRSDLVMLPKFETEGHYIFQDRAVEMWGPAIDKWLKALAPAGAAGRQ